MARWNSPAESGEARCECTLRPPAPRGGGGKRPGGGGGGGGGGRVGAARRFAEDGDAQRVAAELGDVPPHPVQRRLLVHQAIVPRTVPGIGAERGMGEEAEDAE